MVAKEGFREKLLRLSKGRLLRHVPAVLVIVAMVVLLATVVYRRSPIQDEQFHVTRGLAFWWTGDTRLSVAHPPLGNALATLPAAIAFDPVDITALRGWDKGFGSKSRVSVQLFSRDYEQARAMLMLSRTGMIAIAVLFALYFYAFTRSFFGGRAAFCALCLLAFNPTLLAHAAFVTTDFPAAAGAFVMVGELLRYLRSSRRAHLLTFALAAGVAMMAKYTLFGVFVLVLLCWIVDTALRERNPEEPRLARWKRLFVDFAIVGAVVLVVFNVSYRFDNTGWAAERILASFQDTKQAVSGVRRLLAALPGGMPVPLPFSLLRGLSSVSEHVERGHLSYFMGETSSTGWLSYFPIMIAIKTPVPVLALLGAGLVVGIAARKWPSRPIGMLLAISIGFLLMVLPSKMNIGVRHALPIVPFMTVLAGVAATVLIDRVRAADTRLTRFALALPLLGLPLMPVVGVTERVDFLGYFNVLVGRARGHAISVVGEDMGQDASALGRLAKKEQIFPLYYSPLPKFSSYEVERRGVKFFPYECGQELPNRPVFVAIHSVMLLRRPECFPFVEWAELRYDINHHIRVYYVEPKKASRETKRRAARVPDAAAEREEGESEE